MLRAPALIAVSLLASACGSTGSVRLPAAPATLTASASGTTISLAWSASDTATSYALMRGNAAGGPYIAIATPGNTSYVDSGLAAGTAYFYVVRAINAAGSSPGSREASATTTAAAQPPAAPTGVTATGSKGKVTLTWTASPGATMYKIASGLATGIHATLGTSTTPGYMDLAAPAGVTSYYVVVATDAAGDSPASNEASALTAPPPPTALHATAVGQISVNLAWTAATGAVTYTVARGTTAGNESALGSPTQAVSAIDAGLTAGTAYYYVVAATNGSGTSDASAEFVTLTIPSNPVLLTANAGNGVVSLGWPAVNGAASYLVLRSADMGGPYTAASGSLGANGLSYNAIEANGSKVYFVIVARNASGDSDKSNEVSATPQAALPAAPVLTAATPGNGQVSLTWTSAAASFKVYRSTTSANYT